MRSSTRATAAAAVAAALSLAAAGAAEATAGTPSSSAVRPCTINDVSFYFGGYHHGLSAENFSLTLLAHDGISCSLSDIPLITLSGPGNAKIPVGPQGRGGTLILRPDSPLHTTFFYSHADGVKGALPVDVLTLAMPDHTSRASYFGTPDVQWVSSGGVFITSWTTGIGPGQGEGA